MQGVLVVDWLGFGLLGDCEAVVNCRRCEGALVGGDCDGLAFEDWRKGHNGRVSQ